MKFKRRAAPKAQPDQRDYRLEYYVDSYTSTEALVYYTFFVDDEAYLRATDVERRVWLYEESIAKCMAGVKEQWIEHHEAFLVILDRNPELHNVGKVYEI